MDVWLTAARVAAAANAVVLLGLGAVWLRNYLRHGASHTLALLVFAAFLLLENALWLYFYVLHPDFIAWFQFSDVDVQIGVTMLCTLELVALAFVARVTLR